MSFEYFYGLQSDSFSFYRIPRQLITAAQFKKLSMDAKLLYGLMLDRMGLSARNGWYDEQGRVYIYYTVEEIQGDFNCGHDRVLRMLAELDTVKGIGLIERVKQGQGKPTIIYVKQFASAELPSPPKQRDNSAHSRHRENRSQEILPAEVQTSDFPTSRHRETRSADIDQSEANYNNKNHNEKNYTESSILPSFCSQEERDACEAQVRDQIDYEQLLIVYPYDDTDCLLQLICDVLCSTAKSLKIGGEHIPAENVKERYRRLEFDHIAYVMDSLRETTTKIINIRAYLLTALYNAPLTIGPYYAAAVRHDFG